MEGPNNLRMKSDIMKLISKFEVNLKSNWNEFTVKFNGPPNTPYAKGEWCVRVRLPEQYPFESPKINFVNHIYHPNIDHKSGLVCLDVINSTWTALYDLCIIFETFLPQLLTYPNASDPLNLDAAFLWNKWPDRYANQVKYCVRKYASQTTNKGDAENICSLPSFDAEDDARDISEASSLSSLSDCEDI